MATERERAHFAAIADALAEDEHDRLERAGALTAAERIRAGFELSSGVPWTPAHLAQADADADGQMELARKSLALGLRRADQARTSAA